MLQDAVHYTAQTRWIPEGGTMPEQSPLPNWATAEQNAAAWLRAWGYPDARVTVRGADGGLDVVGTRVACQVKFETKPSGRPYLQNLVGAAIVLPGEEDLFFFSRAGYTHGALEYAEGRIALFTYDEHGRPTAANSQAQIIMAKARSNPGAPQTPASPGRFEPFGWFVLAAVLTGAFLHGLFDPAAYNQVSTGPVDFLMPFGLLAAAVASWGAYLRALRQKRRGRL